MPPGAQAATGQALPNGQVGVDGIHGHRIEKNSRLKLVIKDAMGAGPTYPVLVQLVMGGPRHGQVILDSDGTRIACDVAAFIWHDRNGQGNLIAANGEFEIGMGTWSNCVGAAPDPVTPGQVIPVWGTAEILALSAQAKERAQPLASVTMRQWPSIAQTGLTIWTLAQGERGIFPREGARRGQWGQESEGHHAVNCWRDWLRRRGSNPQPSG